MNLVNYCKNLFESIQDYGTMVLIMFSNDHNIDMLTAWVLFEDDISRLCKDLKKVFLDQN